jgi:hypothetical protein
MWEARPEEDSATPCSCLHVGRLNCEAVLLAQSLRAGVAGGLGCGPPRCSAHFQTIARETGSTGTETSTPDGQSRFVSVPSWFSVAATARASANWRANIDCLSFSAWVAAQAGYLYASPTAGDPAVVVACGGRCRQFCRKENEVSRRARRSRREYGPFPPRRRAFTRRAQLCCDAVNVIRMPTTPPRNLVHVLPAMSVTRRTGVKPRDFSSRAGPHDCSRLRRDSTRCCTGCAIPGKACAESSTAEEAC